MKVTWRADGMKQISDTQFEADWLTLREPADHAARDASLLRQAAGLIRPGMRVLDLGSGTGSTARAFARHDFSEFQWRFFDNDPALLQVAKAEHPMSECVEGDVADIGALPLKDVQLVTASALLDLMSLEWVAALVARLDAEQIPFYAALNYDGAMQWDPAMARDRVITFAFNRHQQSEKGTGTALGPEATKVAGRAFKAAGFEVTVAQSPWRIGPDEAMLHRELLQGIGNAAQEAGEPKATEWTRARCADVETSRCVVGHQDMLAWPSALRGDASRNFGR